MTLRLVSSAYGSPRRMARRNVSISAGVCGSFTWSHPLVRTARRPFSKPLRPGRRVRVAGRLDHVQSSARSTRHARSALRSTYLQTQRKCRSPPDRDRAKPPLIHGPLALCTARKLPASRVRRCQPVHEARELAIAQGSQHDVPMIGHDADTQKPQWRNGSRPRAGSTRKRDSPRRSRKATRVWLLD